MSSSKKYNICSLICMSSALICFMIFQEIENTIPKLIGLILGIVLIIISIILEKKAKNPKNSNFRILKSIIVKSKRNKQK